MIKFSVLNNLQGKTYRLKKGSECDVLTMDELHNIILSLGNVEKDLLPGINMANGNVFTNDIKDWNGCIYVDLDTNKYPGWNEEIYKRFKLYVTEIAQNFLPYNYYAAQDSNSGTGLHMFFYFNVEKTVENFHKCFDYVKETILSNANGDVLTVLKYKDIYDNHSRNHTWRCFITKHEIEYGLEIDNTRFGEWKGIDLYKSNDNAITTQSYDLQVNNTHLVSANVVKNNELTWDYADRWNVANTLWDIHKDIDKCISVINTIVDTDQHKNETILYLKSAAANNKTKTIRGIEILKKCGYEFKHDFVPMDIKSFEADEVFNINADEFLFNIWDSKIQNSLHEHTYIYAGCGFGKTYLAKQIGSGRRTCVISPLTSILKDSFEDDNNFIIIDSTHKDEAKHIFGNNFNEIVGHYSVATTWESFCIYNMKDWGFDYIIFDEAHTLYMYDYRLESINNIKNALKLSNAKYKIYLSGTPSQEVEYFDCYKIQVNKPITSIKTEIVGYKKSATGYILNDIKEWVSADENNVALMFYDTVNYKLESVVEPYCIDVDIFNTSYNDIVSQIIETQTVKKQFTAFSVYGQAGINLHIEDNKKARIYILNNNALGIIQYANRVRNKEIIDKVVIPMQVDKINSLYSELTIDESVIETYIEEGNHKVEQLNMMKQGSVYSDGLFELNKKWIFEKHYGLTSECVVVNDDALGKGRYELDTNAYICYRTIQDVLKYEGQLQVIYNRLIENKFSPDIVILDVDVQTLKSGKLSQSHFAGQMMNFDFEQLKFKRDDNEMWLSLNKNCKKVMTGNAEDIVLSLFEKMKPNEEEIRMITEFNADANAVVDVISRRWANLIGYILEKMGSITKKDLERANKWLTYLKNWDTIEGTQFIYAMEDERWDDMKLTALYMRYRYVDGFEWYNIIENVYADMKDLRKTKELFVDYAKRYTSLSTPNKLDAVENDKILQDMYKFLVKRHTRGKVKKQKSVTINGITYASSKEAQEKLGVSASWVTKHKDRIR